MGSVQGSVICGELHAHICVYYCDRYQSYILHLYPGSDVAY